MRFALIILFRVSLLTHFLCRGQPGKMPVLQLSRPAGVDSWTLVTRHRNTLEVSYATPLPMQRKDHPLGLQILIYLGFGDRTNWRCLHRCHSSGLLSRMPSTLSVRASCSGMHSPRVLLSVQLSGMHSWSLRRAIGRHRFPFTSVSCLIALTCRK